MFQAHDRRTKVFLIDYQDIDGGFVSFGRSARGGKITRKGKIRTYKLDFEDVFFVKELKFNLFSVSQMCDKKNSVLFTETECRVLSPDFKLLDASQVLLRVPKQSNMYNFDLKNVVPSGDLTCLFVKATIDESKLWHMRLGHVNFKTINKLGEENLVEVFPSKILKMDLLCCLLEGKATQGSFAERKSRLLIEVARTILADSLLPTVFWTEAVNAACYVLNRNVLDKIMDQEKEATKQSDAVRKEFEAQCNSASRTYNDVGPSFVPFGRSFSDDPLMPDLEDTAEVQNTSIFGSAYDDEDLDTYNFSFM
ncbi:ribonuclease H-like domain-containing protein [Tanacetum coccineum]|uniref:Ribonuclease H-like domain-containing protein n=1 Tax=Tanacetum coccineum TaxID=301880 RepID=A0ABQ4ZLB5_9ASTR